MKTFLKKCLNNKELNIDKISSEEFLVWLGIGISGILKITSKNPLILKS